MNSFESIPKDCELIVHKKVGKLIEKIVNFYELNLSHERFKAVIFNQDEFQTGLEEKVKNYYDAYLYLLNNHKMPFTTSLIKKFYYLIYEKGMDENIALKLSSTYIFFCNLPRITKAIELYLYAFDLLEQESEYERWMISLMFLNYVLVKEHIPCIYLMYSDLKKYLEYGNDKEKIRKLLYNVIVNSKFQKKSYYRNLKKLDRNDIQTFILANEKKLKEDFYLEHIFLYGSFAKNSERLDSDIDFLVIFKEDISYKEKKAKKEAVIEFLTKAFQRFVDIQEIFTVLSKEIVLEASHTKKLL